MPRNRILGLIALAAVLSLAVAAGRIQDEPLSFMTLTDEHAMLQKSIGTWEGELAIYMGPEPMKVPVTEVVEGVGQFWIQSRFSCEMMGMPYLGISSMSYDAAKKKFIGTMIDSQSSFLAIMDGDYDKKTRTLTMSFMAPDMTGKSVPHRNVITYADEDSYSSEFFIGEGEGRRVSSTAMKRKKSAAVDESGN